ncbi:MAG: hypothetical protein IJ343_01500 [Clostridia bacterium]|nr:hypothetical protein [Clostridia bacterium]
MEVRKAAGLAMVVQLAKWLTGFAAAWTGMLLVVLATALAGGVNGWALLVPAVEVLVLTALLAVHIAWSVLTRGRKEGGCGEED